MEMGKGEGKGRKGRNVSARTKLSKREIARRPESLTGNYRSVLNNHGHYVSLKSVYLHFAYLILIK